jgi:hypothetical protein
MTIFCWLRNVLFQKGRYLYKKEREKKKELRELKKRNRTLLCTHGNKTRRDACGRKTSKWQEGKPRGRNELENGIRNCLTPYLSPGDDKDVFLR